MTPYEQYEANLHILEVQAALWDDAAIMDLE
jgi:hypothetical protein